MSSPERDDRIWRNIQRAVDLVLKIWRAIKVSGYLKFYSVTFVAGLTLVGGPDSYLGVFAWFTELLNKWFGTPIFEPQGSVVVGLQIFGGAIMLLSMVLFFLSTRQIFQPSPTEGQIAFVLSKPTTFESTARTIASAAQKPIKFSGFQQGELQFPVDQGNYRFDSAQEALQGIGNALRDGAVLDYAVEFSSGSFLIRRRSENDGEV